MHLCKCLGGCASQYVTALLLKPYIRFISSLALAVPEDGETVNITSLKASSWGDITTPPGNITWSKSFFKGARKMKVIFAMLTQR